jgi:hypothetical protein
MTAASPIRRLTPTEAQAQAVSAFESVFATGNPYRCPFQPSVTSRALVYPTAGFLLSEAHFAALGAAAATVGDERVFVTDVELWDDVRLAVDRRQFLEITLDDYRAYALPPDDLGVYKIVQHAIYSPQGAWGLLISDMRHGILGGPDAFIQTFTNELALDVTQTLVDWLQTWSGLEREGTDVSWLFDLLECVIGKRQAAALWAQSFGTAER